jgi:hypothetical protein
VYRLKRRILVRAKTICGRILIGFSMPNPHHRELLLDIGPELNLDDLEVSE